MDYIIGGLIGSIFGTIISYKIIHSYYQRKWEQIYFEIIKPFQEGK